MEATVEARETAWTPAWYKAGPVEFAAFGDRLLIIEDQFRSGYECKACDGAGETACDQCGGAGKYKRGERTFKCSQCTNGKVKCAECGGKGGVLVVPDVSQRRPSTGRVVSIGEKVKNFEVGHDVLYSNFAGHAMDLDRAGMKIVIRILHESEILARVQGHLELRSVRKQTDSLGTG